MIIEEQTNEDEDSNQTLNGSLQVDENVPIPQTQANSQLSQP